MKSIKVIAEDTRGLIADITEILAAKGINIEEIEGQAFGSQAVVDMIVDKPHDAVMALREKGFKTVSNELITLRLKDEPGAGAKITRELKDADISIRGITTLKREDGHCYLALSTDDDETARRLLQQVVV